MYRRAVAGSVSGVACQRIELTRRPDGPIAEGERQREETGDEEDDDDDVVDSHGAEQLLGSCSVTYEDIASSEDIAFYGQSRSQPRSDAQRRIEQVVCVRVCHLVLSNSFLLAIS